MLVDETLVSIIIPSYNHRQFIGYAIDSVLAQDYSNIECIVVDDGSSDGTFEYYSDFYKTNPKVRISHHANQGAHATINGALGLARGGYLAILNSDDVYEPTRISTMITAARAHGSSFFGITGLKVIDETGADTNAGPALYYRKTLALLDQTHSAARFWVGNSAMTTSNFFFTRPTLDKVGPFRALRYTHDWDWALRAQELVGCHRIDEPLLSYRVHGSNTISEGRIWTHIAENAFIFASMLRRSPLITQQDATDIPAPDILGYILRNESFLPLPTLALLATGLNDEEMLARLSTGELEIMLERVLQTSGIAIDHMLSIEHAQHLFAMGRQQTDHNTLAVTNRSLAGPLRTAIGSIRDFISSLSGKRKS